MFLFFSFTLRVFGFFLNSMHPQFFLQGGSISTDIKIYTRATFVKQGPLNSTFGPPQDFSGPSNVGDSIPVQGTKIPHGVGQESPRATAREKPTHCN